MRIFVSHASEQSDIASSIALSLRHDGHDVFVARASLPPGESYDNRIRSALAESDLLVFPRVQAEAKDYPSAWTHYEQAAAVRPDSAAVVDGRQILAMTWLDDIRVTAGRGTFTEIVERVSGVLAACAASADPVRAADCRAHLGWADFLRSREGRGDRDPVAHYRQALDRDPGNVYAHAMWGFEILRTGGSLAGARARFDRALAARREPAYVRRLQLAGLLWRRDPLAEHDIVRVANDLRGDADAGPGVLAEYRWRVWNVYYDRLLNGTDMEAFLAALPPADHLATFLALFPAADIPADKQPLYRFMLGTLPEPVNAAQARSTFEALHDALARDGTLASAGRLPDRTTTALRRLQKASPPRPASSPTVR